MHIYLLQMYPLQLSIDVWNTLHQISFTYSRMHIYLWQMDPLPIDHKCMEYCYTKYL